MSRPRGRPSDYTPELAEEICEAISSTDYGLEYLCRTRDDFPDPRTVWAWKAAKPDFHQMVTRAKERQSEKLAYDALRGLHDVDADLGAAHVTKAKNIADYTVKLIPKLAPRTMGDRHAVEMAGSIKTENVPATPPSPDLVKAAQESMQGE